MLIKNEFTQHFDVAEKAKAALDLYFVEAVKSLHLFDVKYLVATNPKDYQTDLIKKFQSADYQIALQEAVLSSKVVGQTSNGIITYNSGAFNSKATADLQVARLAGNVSHELGHIFGYYHNSKRFFVNTSNWFSTDKALHSIPYLLGYLTYALYLKKTDLKAEVSRIAYNGGVL